VSRVGGCQGGEVRCVTSVGLVRSGHSVAADHEQGDKQSEQYSFHPPIQAHLWARVKGWGGWGLFLDRFAVFIGDAKLSAPYSGPTYKTVPVLYVGLGTLLAVVFPSNCRHELAVLVV